MNYQKMLAEGKTTYVYIHPALKVFGAVVLVLVFSIAGNTAVRAEQEARSCAELRAQGLVPQDVFTINPTKWARLDRDNDGLACE